MIGTVGFNETVFSVGEASPRSKRRSNVDSLETAQCRLLAHLVAEGVERADQLATLIGYGCGQVQGYHFAKPMPATEVAEFMRAFTRQAQGGPNRGVQRQSRPREREYWRAWG